MTKPMMATWTVLTTVLFAELTVLALILTGGLDITNSLEVYWRTGETIHVTRWNGWIFDYEWARTVRNLFN